MDDGRGEAMESGGKRAVATPKTPIDLLDTEEHGTWIARLLARHDGAFCPVMRVAMLPPFNRKTLSDGKHV